MALCCEIKLNISQVIFVANLRHTCAIFMLSNLYLDLSNLWGGIDYLGKGEVLANTDLKPLYFYSVLKAKKRSSNAT